MSVWSHIGVMVRDAKISFLTLLIPSPQRRGTTHTDLSCLGNDLLVFIIYGERLVSPMITAPVFTRLLFPKGPVTIFI